MTESECWLLPANTTGGYVSVQSNDLAGRALLHRLTYLVAGGQGRGRWVQNLEHTCGHNNCINPTHLREMVLRDQEQYETWLKKPNRREHCPAGHEYTLANSYFRGPDASPECRQCRNVQSRKRRLTTN